MDKVNLLLGSNELGLEVRANKATLWKLSVLEMRSDELRLLDHMKLYFKGQVSWALR